MGDPARIVLASASPRRHDLLSRVGLTFEVQAADITEVMAPGLDARAVARDLAEQKARAVALRLGAGSPTPRWILGADTVVAAPVSARAGRPARWELLGKPVDAVDAARMLRLLAGSRHQVITGICVVRLPEGLVSGDAETTWVTMRPLDQAEVAGYVASGEWRDKAGGYAIQESADRFVTALAGGGFDNVVGLPVARTLALLGRSGAPVPV